MSDGRAAESDAQGLEAAARRALSQQARKRVIVFDWNGGRHVLKRMASKPRSRMKQTLLRAFFRRLFPRHVLSGSFGLGDGLFESNRVRGLAQAGMRVPMLELQMSDAMVYGYCGVPLRQYLKERPPAERERLLIRATLDLAGFHKAGCWHGGAQLRNILVQGDPGDERFWRIDFEEDLEGLFALPVLQIYDLGLFLVEALRFSDGEEAAIALGERLFNEYRARHWSADLQEVWLRFSAVIRRIKWLVPLLRRVNHKESNRLVVLSGVVYKVLTSEVVHA
jgi:hypothetical protein